jgi:hypothetical protein
MADETGSQQGQGEGGTGAEGDDTQQGTEGAQGATGSQQGASGEGAQGDDTVARSELEAVKQRMIAADKRAADAEKKLDEQARKEKTDLENAQADLTKANERIAALEKQLNSTAVETEFVKYGKHDWVDVSDALRLLDREGVEVADGKVTGLGPAIEKLVKAKPYLLKKNNNDQNDSSGASGSANNGSRKGEKVTPPANFGSRFPALRNSAAAKK